MDFSNAGVTSSLGGGVYRADVQWKDNGVNRHIQGPRRPDEETAMDFLRAAAIGMSREDGFAAMAAEAERLKAGKAPSKQGSVMAFGEAFSACIQWRATGEMRHVYGPRRAEEKRAQADLEAMREAASMEGDVLTSRVAIFTKARSLQQQAEHERRVELFAHRRDKAQRAAEEEECDSDNSDMGFEACEELDEEDDGMVDYAWKSRDELLKQWQEQQEKKPPLPPLPEPSCADEASLLLAQLHPDSYRRRRVAGALSHVPFRD